MGEEHMTYDQIQAYRTRLIQILADEYTGSRHQDLIQLAIECGAATVDKAKGHGKAGIGELVENINNALQTASMVEACRIASDSCTTAQKATREAMIHNRIAAIISILAMLAAWVSVIILASKQQP